MFPRPFAYHQPKELEGALSLLSDLGDQAAPYAGGTELLLMLKLRLAEFTDLVNLKRIEGLNRIHASPTALSVGALATHAEIARDALVRRLCPALAELCGSIGNARVRAAGTLGGNICFAEPRADPPVLLGALGARYVLRSVRGTRMADADGFAIGPFETRRENDEVLTEILIPLNGSKAVCARIEAGSHSLATAALVTGEATVLRLGYGAGAPFALAAAQSYLAGTWPSPDHRRLKEIVENETADLEVAGDVEAGEAYRRHLMTVAVARAVRAALSAAKGSGT